MFKLLFFTKKEESARKIINFYKDLFLDHTYLIFLLEGIVIGLIGNIFVSHAGTLFYIFSFSSPNFFLSIILFSIYLMFVELICSISSLFFVMTKARGVFTGEQDAFGNVMRGKSENTKYIFSQIKIAVLNPFRSFILIFIICTVNYLVFSLLNELLKKNPSQHIYKVGIASVLCLSITMILWFIWEFGFVFSKKNIEKNKINFNFLREKLGMRKIISLMILSFFLITSIIVVSCKKTPEDSVIEVQTEKTPEVIKVGYLSITPNLPFYTAIENKMFEEEGLNIEPIPLQTSNNLVEALLTGRVDFTTVAALSVLQSVEVASPGRIKIYQVNYIPKSDPNDYLIVKKGSGIGKIEDLKGKKIALYPGSNFNVWAKLIFGDHFGFGGDLVTVSMPPPVQASALAAGSVDAIYCLEPTGTIALERGIGELLEVGLVCNYIFDPFPVTGNAVLTEYANKYPETTRKFCEIMYKAIKVVENNPATSRPYLEKYCKIDADIAAKVVLGHGAPSSEVDSGGLQKTVLIYFEAGLLEKEIDMEKMLLYPLEMN